MRTPVWIEKDEVLVMHDLLLAEHGGAEGIRDEGLLESALGRPKNIFHYGRHVSLPQMAAAYAAGITGNHPFIDGNKRTALVVTFTFLECNGVGITASQEDTYMVFWLLAQGKLKESDLADWIIEHSTPIRE